MSQAETQDTADAAILSKTQNAEVAQAVQVQAASVDGIDRWRLGQDPSADSDLSPHEDVMIYGLIHVFLKMHKVYLVHLSSKILYLLSL